MCSLHIFCTIFAAGLTWSSSPMPIWRLAKALVRQETWKGPLQPKKPERTRIPSKQTTEWSVKDSQIAGRERERDSATDLLNHLKPTRRCIKHPSTIPLLISLGGAAIGEACAQALFSRRDHHPCDCLRYLPAPNRNRYGSYACLRFDNVWQCLTSW